MKKKRFHERFEFFFTKRRRSTDKIWNAKNTINFNCYTVYRNVENLCWKVIKRTKKREYFVRWHVFKVASWSNSIHVSIHIINCILHVTVRKRRDVTSDRHINAGMSRYDWISFFVHKNVQNFPSKSSDGQL